MNPLYDLWTTCARILPGHGAFWRLHGSSTAIAADASNLRLLGAGLWTGRQARCHKRPKRNSALGRGSGTGRGMSLFSEIFFWWGGNTWGNRWDTWRRGKLVGEDAT